MSLRDLAAQLVIPLLDLRASAEREPAAEWEHARTLRDAGVGGFILFGGERADVARGLADLRAGAPRGLLVGADLERGLAQQVVGGSALPPAMALGASDDEALAEEAGRALGREALAVGIDWVLGPVLDLADEPRNPIVGARAFSADPARVAALGAAFVRGVQSAGALACAKHFPGHGATTADSHDDLPVVARSAEELEAQDLLPFRAAVDAGVASVMTAHVRYPSLSGDPAPATLNPALARDLLRDRLGFRGAVVTDALIMAGVQQEGSEVEAAPRAVAAGCDLLLYPQEPLRVIDALVRWASADPAHAARLEEAAGRVAAARERVGPAQGDADDDGIAGSAAAAGERIAAAAITRLGAPLPPLAAGQPVAALVLDDDGVLGLGHELLAELAVAGVILHPATLGSEPTERERARCARVLEGAERVLALVGCRVRAWKGRPGLSADLEAVLRGLPGARTSVVGLCGPYPLRGALPDGAEVLLAYGDEAACQAAAARVLLGAAAPGVLPVPSAP
jgi:beta-N-acetylhexosaminidase